MSPSHHQTLQNLQTAHKSIRIQSPKRHFQTPKLYPKIHLILQSLPLITRQQNQQANLTFNKRLHPTIRINKHHQTIANLNNNKKSRRLKGSKEHDFNISKLLSALITVPA